MRTPSFKIEHLKLRILFFSLLLSHVGFSQKKEFNRYDSLRGSLSPLRSCYDVYFYDLLLNIDIPGKSIAGSNKIYYKAVDDFQKLQVDLFGQMKVDSIVFENRKLKFQRDSHAVFIEFPESQRKNEKNSLEIFYSGTPVVAKKAPWDGGFVWTSDSLGNPWVGVACQGLGASSWWPCKDHLSDEPDSMRMSFSVPSTLSCISNGNLIKKESRTDRVIYTWRVSYPINTYNVTLNIGNYAHFQDQYIRADSSVLPLDYYVLGYNLTKAKTHFGQVKKMLKAYEHFFGRYPFPEDGYALVETPYWGMEHQSAIAYGNNYVNKLIDFDFIIVHESAHEWWGNSLSAADMAELWIHESFATYSEALLLEYFYGYDKALNYLIQQRKYIRDESPLLKPEGVGFFHSEDSDIYFKGAWMLHTLRNVISNDSLWFSCIYSLSEKFRLSTVSTDTLIDHFNKQSGLDLTPIFEQYLKYASPPTLLYELKRKGKKMQLMYKWEADVKNFNMPVIVELNNKKRTKLAPTSSFQSLILEKKAAENVRIMTELFYINTKNLGKK